MLLYIAATPRVISVVIMVERTEEGKELPVQRSVYYLSEVLTLSKQDIPAGVSLEIIHKPSIKPSSESISIYMPGDPAPAQVPPPDPGAAVSGLKEEVGQPNAAGSTKDRGIAGSTPTPPAGQSDEAGATMDPGAANPLVASVFHIREIPSWAEPFSNYLITGDLPQDEAEARRIQRRAGSYTIINSELYKRSVSGIF
jgi:hypothetical protein